MNIQETMKSVLLFLLLSLVTVHALHPIVLVPGLGASQIDAKLNREHPLDGCPGKSDWFNIWLNLKQAFHIKCFVDNFKLNINEVDGTTTNQEGVETRIPSFGNTETVEWLSPTHPFEILTKKFLGYFERMVSRLVNNLNYERNLSIRGAPYDFRKAPNELGDFMKNLTKLIEETYEKNDNQKVILITHSLGGRMALYFLHNKTKMWKNKYIEAFIPIAAPWAGSVKVLKMITSGDDLNRNPLVGSLDLRPLQQSFPSAAWLLPDEPVWTDKDVLVVSPDRNYTVKDYNEFFDDVQFPQAKILRKVTKNLVQTSIGPGVKTFCMYGLINESTADTYIYTNALDRWFDETPNSIDGLGDGSVNKRSLEVCKKWPDTHVYEFPNVNHKGALSDLDVYNQIEIIISNL